MGEPKLDLLQGTLDLMVLQTLAAMGRLCITSAIAAARIDGRLVGDLGQ